MIKRAIAAALLAAAIPAAAANLTFAAVCKGFTLKQTATALEVRCPGNPPTVWLRINGCLAAKASRQGATITVTCASGSSWGFISA